MPPVHVAVVGSGFAGAIMARVARAQGHDTTLVERGTHPRFALGESSTPLAAIALERLAARYGLTDLHALAAYSRWRTELPDLRRGLKRGFTFYRHEAGAAFRNNTANSNRLLVAASPDDEIADVHWFREDVDQHLVHRAQVEGVDYLDSTTVTGVETHASGIRLQLDQRGRTRQLSVDLVVDASGAAGAVARHVGADNLRVTGGLHTGLVFGHFENVRPLWTSAPNAAFPDGPFADEHAAVHHLLDEGWMYELRFDDGVVSSGFVIENGRGGPALEQVAPQDAFSTLLTRYPTLAAQYAMARPTRPLGVIPRLQRVRTRAAGTHWALLPHTYTFWSPLFSTGIAWSLVAVERLGLAVEDLAVYGRQHRAVSPLQRYGSLLETEAAFLRTMVETAYSARHTFDLFDAVSQVYFAAASYNEAAQRLCDPPLDLIGGWAWSGLLGATDPIMGEIVERTAQLVRSGATQQSTILKMVARLIGPRNVAGLADPGKRRLYPVSLAALSEGADALGLSPATLNARLSRLRGQNR
jgi:FADH2 O2-dependent halogenase